MTQPISQQAAHQILNHLGQRALGGPRLCGAGRTAGSCYIESGISINGTPIEQHLCDPPMPIDIVQLGLTPLGMTTFVENGVKHLVDIVGSSHYPEVADFISEASRMGISRKIAANLNETGFSAASKIYLIHERACLDNAQVISADSQLTCPNGRHLPGDDCCGLHWVLPPNDGPLHRQIGAQRYEITPRRLGQPGAQYHHGIFMVAAISNLTIIRDHTGHISPGVLNAARRTGLSVHLADF